MRLLQSLALLARPRSVRVLRALPLLVTTLALAAPRVALACAVCAGGNPANRTAIFMSTIVLSLLPLGLFAGAFLWLLSRMGPRRAEEFRERDVPVSPDAEKPSAAPAPSELRGPAVSRTLPHTPAG